MVTWCLPRHYASTDMQYNQLRSSSDHDHVRSNFDLTFQGQNAYLSTRLEEKHDGYRNHVASLLRSKALLKKNIFTKKN